MSADILKQSDAAVQIAGSLMWEDHTRLEQALREAAEGEGSEMKVDLSDVTFVFSSAVALLVAAGVKACEQGKEVVFLIPERLAWVARYLKQVSKPHGFNVRMV